jgi:hypothetical protein
MMRLSMSQVPHTFVVDSIWLKIPSLLLEIMASRMATFYGPQIAQVNEEPAPESSLNLMLTQHLHDENPASRKVRAHLEVDPPQTWYHRISPNSRTLVFCCRSTLLLVMNLKPYVKVLMRLKTPPFSHGLQFLALDIIVGCAV